MMQASSRTSWHRVLAVLAMLLFTQPAMAEECRKAVRWNDDPPYFSRSVSGQVEGINADLITEILQRIGCKPVFQEMPWARALLELESGRLDVLPGAFKTPEREKFAYFSNPINRSANVLFMSKQANAAYHFERLADMAQTDFRLGAQIKVSYGADYDALLSNPAFNARITPVTQRLGAWKMIAANRLDGIIADQLTAMAELQRLGLNDAIVKSNVVVSSDPSMVAFSRKSVSLAWVEQFNQAFEAVKADGSYRRIMGRYLSCKVSVEKLGCV